MSDQEKTASREAPPTDRARWPTHRCKLCGALWQRNSDGTWSLVSAACGKCCDNAPMGEQIEPLPFIQGPDDPWIVAEKLAAYEEGRKAGIEEAAREVERIGTWGGVPAVTERLRSLSVPQAPTRDAAHTFTMEGQDEVREMLGMEPLVGEEREKVAKMIEKMNAPPPAPHSGSGTSDAIIEPKALCGECGHTGDCHVWGYDCEVMDCGCRAFVHRPAPAPSTGARGATPFGSLLDSLVIAVAANAGHMVVGAKPPDDAASRRAAVEAAFAEVEAERDGWRHVAAYYLGDFSDSHGPAECRAEAIRRAVETGDPAFEHMVALALAAESSASALRARVEALAKEWTEEAARKDRAQMKCHRAGDHSTGEVHAAVDRTLSRVVRALRAALAGDDHGGEEGGHG